MADALLDELVRSPRLVLYMDRMRAILRDERERRERFYNEMDESGADEFINGEVVFHSPVPFMHIQARQSLVALLDTYVSANEVGKVASGMLVSLTRNDYQPDLSWFDVEKASCFTPDQIHLPAPGLVVEVLSPSTESNDRGVKFDDYAAHGVREYWIIDPDAEVVEQYVLANDSYELRLKMNSGLLRSEVVGGFEIPVRAIFDERENLAALRRILDQVA